MQEHIKSAIEHSTSTFNGICFMMMSWSLGIDLICIELVCDVIALHTYAVIQSVQHVIQFISWLHSANHWYSAHSRSSHDECILYDDYNILLTQKINYIPIQFMRIWAPYTGELLSLIYNTICHWEFVYKAYSALAYNVVLCTRIFIIHINGIIFSKNFSHCWRYVLELQQNIWCDLYIFNCYYSNYFWLQIVDCFNAKCQLPYPYMQHSINCNINTSLTILQG